MNAVKSQTIKLTEGEKAAYIAKLDQKLREVSQDYNMITEIHDAVCRGDKQEIDYQFDQLMILCREEDEEHVGFLKWAALTLISKRKISASTKQRLDSVLSKVITIIN